MALRDYVMPVKIAAWMGAVSVIIVVGVVLALRQLDVIYAHLPAEALRHVDAFRTVFLCTTALCVALLVALAYLIITNISKPLHQAASFAQQLARGDLSASIKSARTDEMGWLYNELGNMAQSLRETAREVRGGAYLVSSSADKIRVSTAQRLDAQAATLEESVAAIRHLSDAVKQNAQQASTASSMASGVGSGTAKSREVVERIVDSMNAISASSKKIEDIIGVIDGITFQTNILALNAAVEAARAGEQGKGFGVVAAEVRTLAQRSADASKEIKASIQQSSVQIQAGGELVREAVRALRETMNGIQNVAGLARSIQETSGEQLSAVEQLNQALNQIEHVSRENLLLAQDTEADVISVQQQAHRLVELVAKFKLDENETGEEAAVPKSTVLPNAAQSRRRLPSAAIAAKDEWAEF